MAELAWIVGASLVGGLCSVLAAAFISFTLLRRWVSRLVSVSVGVLLAVALTDLIPEAVDSGIDLHEAGTWILVGLLSFFVVEKLAIWRHDHALPGEGAAPAATVIVIGDAMHNFVDGVLIAAAFLQDTTTGIAAAIAVVMHEIPQEIGDFMVLLESGLSRTRALFFNIVSSLTALVGGVLAWWVLSMAQSLVPYALLLAAAGFIYVAVADLVPALHRQRQPYSAPLQVFLMLIGVGLVSFGHSH